LASRWERAWTNPVVRGLLLFSAFRAVYGVGILVMTVVLATNEATPWWVSLLFLASSMVFSRWLFKRLKKRWPALFTPQLEESETKVRPI
jgi:biotin transporter BioY